MHERRRIERMLGRNISGMRIARALRRSISGVATEISFDISNEREYDAIMTHLRAQAT